jgi:PhnB protein
MGCVQMVGVEIDLVVSDSLKALELYEKVFEIERIKVTTFPKGENEVVFTLYGVQFHM